MLGSNSSGAVDGFTDGLDRTVGLLVGCWRPSMFSLSGSIGTGRTVLTHLQQAPCPSALSDVNRSNTLTEDAGVGQFCVIAIPLGEDIQEFQRWRAEIITRYYPLVTHFLTFQFTFSGQ